MRTQYFPGSTIKELDRVLEKSCDTRMDEPLAGSNLAARIWDRQLRPAESYEEKWQYVKNNPVRHGFVSHAEDWPYQGELNVLEWHDR